MNYESIHKAARKSAEEFEYSERQKASKLARLNYWEDVIRCITKDDYSSLTRYLAIQSIIFSLTRTTLLLCEQVGKQYELNFIGHVNLELESDILFLKEMLHEAGPKNS
jgi:hypothetical protein